jgi:hypothetical protein
MLLGADSDPVVDFAVYRFQAFLLEKMEGFPCQVGLEVLHAFLLQFQAPLEQMFDDGCCFREQA